MLKKYNQKYIDDYAKFLFALSTALAFPFPLSKECK
jgi:hypothetical protein